MFRTVRFSLHSRKRFESGQVAQLVERSPEKAGVGGSIPSLATMKSKTYTIGFFALLRYFSSNQKMAPRDMSGSVNTVLLPEGLP